MLNISNLNAYYGKSHILQGVTLKVKKGEIVSLLGRNGVGRSTTIKSIMGMVKATGSIKLFDKEILGKQIATLHNLSFYLWLVREARKHILAGTFSNWKTKMVCQMKPRL